MSLAKRIENFKIRKRQSIEITVEYISRIGIHNTVQPQTKIDEELSLVKKKLQTIMLFTKLAIEPLKIPLTLPSICTLITFRDPTDICPPNHILYFGIKIA